MSEGLLVNFYEDKSKNYKGLRSFNRLLIVVNILFLLINAFFLYTYWHHESRNDRKTIHTNTNKIVKINKHPLVVLKDTVKPIIVKDTVKPIPEESKPDKKQDAKVNTHIVESGQTLFSISRMYRVPVDSIERANKLKDYTITVGQKLKIPAYVERRW